MKKSFVRSLSVLLVVLMALTVLPLSTFAASDAETVIGGKTVEELKAQINTLYDSGTGTTGRLRKMQAFIMELALHAKTQNPDFKIIPQDGINLAFNDGDWNQGVQPELLALVDGWGIEGMVGSSAGTTPSETQQKYMKLVENGLYVSDTTSVSTEAALNNYYARANAWGITPYPRVGGTLAQSLFPGWRWASNGDYFWVDNPNTIGVGGRIDSARDVYKLTDAQNYLYNINSRPYDAWETWDAEEAIALADGDADRTRITDSYGCGLLVPSAGGPYTPAGNAATVSAAKALYGDEWDWWWREAGLDESAGRETWLNALRNSDYDVIYIDTFYNHRAFPENQTPLTREEVDSLKYKPGGGRRQVIGYLSIGSAEQNRWYCQDEWTEVDPSNPNTSRSMRAGKTSGSGSSRTYTPADDAPTWLAFGYGGNYTEEAIVQWWDSAWRDIIINGGGQYAHKTTGDNTSSLDRIINQGFDGVYLDNVGVYSNGSWPAFETYWTNNGGIPGEPVVSTFNFTYGAEGVIDGSVPNDDGTVWSTATKALPNHANTISVPAVSVPSGWMLDTKNGPWMVTASQDPAYAEGDVVADPSAIVAGKSITFELKLLEYGKIEVTGVAGGNGQANVEFGIVSANGKGYTLYLSDAADGEYAPYDNVNYNAKGAHIKGLTNDQTYYAFIEYVDAEGFISRSAVVELTPSKK